jgi:hypothetical protein
LTATFKTIGLWRPTSGFQPDDSGELVPHEAGPSTTGKPLRAIANATDAKKGHRISHQGVAGVLRATGEG